MSVLIQGMEMPTSCEKCPFLDYEEGFCLASGIKGKRGWYESVLCPGSIKDGRHSDCPLIPIPPHGRLIDADAMCDGLVLNNPVVIYAECMPTIIPADPQKEET